MRSVCASISGSTISSSSSTRPSSCSWRYALAALILTALLDAVENHHILLMLHGFQHGAPISVDELEWQMRVSNLKFHASYVGVFLFAFGLYRLGGLARVIAFLVVIRLCAARGGHLRRAGQGRGAVCARAHGVLRLRLRAQRPLFPARQGNGRITFVLNPQ